MSERRLRSNIGEVPWSRVLLAVGGALFTLAVLGSFLPGGGSSAGRSPSSSYSTRPDGLAAYAELLTRFGRPAERLRGDLEPGLLDPVMTVVALDAPTLDRRQAGHLRRFVQDGGRLLAGGFGADEWLGTVLDDPPAYSGDGPASAHPLRNVPEVEGVRAVKTAGNGSWETVGELTPVLGRGHLVVAATARVGQGEVVALADPSPLQNRLLDQADNAAFGLGLAGRGRAVQFLEGPHGYGRGEGLAALPRRWRLALAGLGLATAVWLLARSRRLGPPEEEARPLPPPRRAYVDALAGTLARTRRPREATEPVRARARQLLAERAALPVEDHDEELRRAAGRLGLPADEVEAILGGAAGDESILAAGRALARLTTGAGGP